MKKRFLTLLLAGVLLLSGCSPAPAQGEATPRLTVACTTYPVYLLAQAVAEGVEGVEVRAVVNQSTSCLHDYTLTVADMKTLEGADVIVLNGAGLEDFMADALAAVSAAVIDCSAGVELLPYGESAEEHAAHGGEDHDHGEYDPHIWMDPERAGLMAQNLGEGLAAADPDHAETYRDNAAAAAAALHAELQAVRDSLSAGPDGDGLETKELITFHDGFGYFAEALDLHVLKAIEEEEGSETSAREIREIVGLIEEYHIPAIFTEVNGSDATARAIQRETGVEVGQLSMMMSGDGGGLSAYLDAFRENARTVAAMLGKEGAELP